jgi:KDO2-lipid IV(A) lauroyltransferase
VSGDVREGAPWGAFQAAKNGAIYLALRIVLAAASLVPRSVLRIAGRTFGVFAYFAVAPARHLALANLALAFPGATRTETKARARASYWALGAHLGEAVAALSGRPAPLLPVTPEARAVLDEALREGKGIVFASAHLGPWERVAASVVASGYPLVTLARDSYDPRLTRHYDRLRGSSGVRSIYRGSPGAAARIVRTLRRNELLGAPMDLATRAQSIDAPFLGLSAPTVVGPARLALRTGAAVVVATIAPAIDGSLCVTATRIEARDLGATTEGEHVLTARLNAELGARISALPAEWVWMHDRRFVAAEETAVGGSPPLRKADSIGGTCPKHRRESQSLGPGPTRVS